MKHAIWLTALLLTQVASAQQGANRSALIIGVAQYGYPGISALNGVNIDMGSATKIANAMVIPDKNIKYLKNSDATKENVLRALSELSDSTTEGSSALPHPKRQIKRR